MRRRARKDANHAAIVAGLRSVGVSVLELHQLGGGVPDVLAGRNGRERLLEVKPPGALSGGHKVSAPGQSEWAARWRGIPVAVVTSLDEALEALR